MPKKGKTQQVEGKTSTGKSHKPQLSHNCANTRAHLKRVKPRPRVINHKLTTSSKARVGRERRHHTGTDYWLIRPISNPDNKRTTSQPRSHGRKVQLPLHKEEVKQLWRPTNTTPADTEL
ncbi:hypothetical protein Taro_032314 [Colocasia esculenta]|uniref:Uncharacterized protein n=1 Tax=Colocasia esculenta TaxID=4460 RepID=A0A843VX06_COLES|nr:hypothetical protein [Colocasia esculenta]